MIIPDLFEFIQRRIKLNRDYAMVITNDEIDDWPDGGLELLISQGILTPMQPRKDIICDGCEEMCIMPVEVIPKSDKRNERAFIACDKRDNIDIVPVELERLRRWKINDLGNEKL